MSCGRDREVSSLNFQRKTWQVDTRAPESFYNNPPCRLLLFEELDQNFE